MASLTSNSSSGAQEKPTEEDIFRKPWKYLGYAEYARFIASDDDFFILRRFDALNARVALALQDEISQLEERLQAMDEEHSRKTAPDVDNGTFRGKGELLEARNERLKIIAEKLFHYNEFLFQQTKLRPLGKAPKRNVDNIRNWHYNYSYKAIAQVEQKYLEHEEDLFLVTSQEKTPLRRLIDSSHWLRTLPIWKEKKQRSGVDLPRFSETGHVSYYSNKRIDAFASLVIFVMGSAMLIAPLWILQHMNNLAPEMHQLIVITCFVLAFLIILSFALASKPFEALGATAAYAAVLMVFIQGSTGSGS